MQKLLRDLKKFYSTNKRDLPWRKTHDPYHILVSEIMLQQTQVLRVIPKYKAFIKRFPTAKKLAEAKLSEILSLWSGLGYNRRARYLHQAAKIITNVGFSAQKLPGVGAYTSAAIGAFAHNQPSVFIETNIRSVFTHFCFPHKKVVSDKEILPLVGKALQKSKMQPRDFYAALMDYGSYLKSKGVKVNKKSKHYTKQKKFEGSVRQLRGRVIRELLKKPKTLSQLAKGLSQSKGETLRALAQLQKEQLIRFQNRKYLL